MNATIRHPNASRFALPAFAIAGVLILCSALVLRPGTPLAENLGHLGGGFLATLGAFALAVVSHGLAALGRWEPWSRRIGVGLTAAGWALVTALLAARWVEAGRPPFKSLYESLLLFTFCTSLLQLGVDRYYRIAWLAAATSALTTGVLVYAVAKADAEIVNLPAALQSPWFVPHVAVYFFAYAALGLGFLTALLHLWRPGTDVVLHRPNGTTTHTTYAGFMHLANTVGFVLLTVGLVFGAVWAKAAWGDWWVWDPKENWALVSWLAFAAYLHLRRTPGFSERQGAWATIGAFGAVIFCWLGMHLLPTAASSAHVYQ